MNFKKNLLTSLVLTMVTMLIGLASVAGADRRRGSGA